MPLLGKAVPFSREVLKRYFGTGKPTRAIAEAVLAQPEVAGTMYRNVGYYTVLYKDEAPSEIVFAGRSGD